MARTALAVVVLGALVVVAVLALGQPAAPGGGNATATPGATASPEATSSPGAAISTPTATTVTDASPAPTQSQSPMPSDEPVAFTNPDGPPPGDEALERFLVAANELPTFAITRVDDNQRDYHISLTGDIEGAIEAIGDDLPRGITVYFYIVEHTMDELCELRDRMFNDRDELMTHGIVLMSGGCGSAENRVHIGMSPFTPETIAYMEERYPGPVDYAGGGITALAQFEPPEVATQTLSAIEAIDDLGLMTCGGRPFPASALDAAAAPRDGTGPEDGALNEALQIYVDIYGDLSSLTWVEAERDEFGATFLARRGDEWMEAPVFAGIAGWVPGTIDDCSPRPFTEADSGDANWWLDPDYPAPGPADTEIHVLVMETACANGRSPAGSITPPTATYQRDRLQIEIGVRPVPGGATCPGNPSFPITIVLPEPIGDRELAGASEPNRF